MYGVQMLKRASLCLLMVISVGLPTTISAAPSYSQFESVGPDRVAIEKLLAEYTAAVSTKDQARFEALLLNKTIPFSDVGSTVAAGTAPSGTQNYETFRRDVFEGPPFIQRFQDVKILQDGPLAEVSLVFINSAAGGSSWGWKTMQLLKIGGHWKIASEFFTGHG